MRRLFRRQGEHLMSEKSRELAWLGEPGYLHCSKIVQSRAENSLSLMNRFASLVIENKLVIIRTLEAKHVVQRAG